VSDESMLSQSLRTCGRMYLSANIAQDVGLALSTDSSTLLINGGCQESGSDVGSVSGAHTADQCFGVPVLCPVLKSMVHSRVEYRLAVLHLFFLSLQESSSSYLIHVDTGVALMLDNSGLWLVPARYKAMRFATGSATVV
jgi:hypothetical protein